MSDVARTKARKDRYRAAGLCITCGNPANPGRSFCEADLLKARRYQAKKTRACRDAGVCIAGGCNRDASPPSPLCAPHKLLKGRQIKEWRTVHATIGDLCKCRRRLVAAGKTACWGCSP